MRSLPVAVITLMYFFFDSLLVSSQCVDGVDNAITINDLYRANLPVKFRNVKVLVYDVKKRPWCSYGKPSVRFPGYLKIYSGEIEIEAPLYDSDEKLKVDLTLEKNSYFIGKVCDDGVSTSFFVDDELCKFELCEVLGVEWCPMFEKKGVLTIESLPDVAKDFIPLQPLSVPQALGEWRVVMHLKQGEKMIGAVRIGEEEEWISIEAGKKDEF